jgi:hypothetical protein
MSASHDEIFNEIDSARKLLAEFKSRPNGSARAAQAMDSAGEAVPETRAGEEAESAALEENQAEPREDAAVILEELAEARAEERAAAKELIRKASEKQDAASHADPGQQKPPPLDAVRYTWFPGIGASHVWYFTAGRERCGPVTFKDLRTMAASGVLDPRLDMVWKKGMPEWKQAGVVDGLFERNLIKEEVAAAPPPRTAAVKPLRSSALLEKLASGNIHWPGIGRRILVPGVLLFPILWNRLLFFASPLLESQLGFQLMNIIHPSLAIVPPVVLAFLMLNRLANVGMNRWWSLAIMIPLLNCWIAFLCLFCPAGYAYHRKIDKSGLIMIAAFAVILPFTWQDLPKHPVATYSAYLQTGIRSVALRVEKIVLPHL